MIRKFEEKDINAVMEIWKNENAIRFYEKNNFIITSENIDKNTNEIEYTMTWKRLDSQFGNQLENSNLFFEQIIKINF